MDVKEYVEAILEHAKELADLDGFHVLSGKTEQYLVTALCDALCTTIAMTVVESMRPVLDRLSEIESRLSELEKGD